MLVTMRPMGDNMFCLKVEQKADEIMHLEFAEYTVKKITN